MYISIHALLAESDVNELLAQSSSYSISIHALLAESDTKPIPAVTRVANFYPRSPCGERHDQGANNQTEQQISIHALLAESDGNPHDDTGRNRFLSTLSLRRATISRIKEAQDNGFLSTLSLRRATRKKAQLAKGIPDFYPRSPCGERRMSIDNNRIR